MDFERCGAITHDEYFNMITLKTAVLIACAAQTGALCGGAAESDARHLYDFGFALGMGFQIRDDYLDSFGERATFGKSIGGDILNNKKTWLLVDALHKARGTDLKEINRLLGMRHAPEEKIAGIIHLYKKLEVPQAAQEEISRFHLDAFRAIEKVQLPPHQKEQLCQYVDSLLQREK
jgi:geranylgeranyl diphosphate synthase type II